MHEGTSPWVRPVAGIITLGLLAAGLTVVGSQPAVAAGCDTATYGGDVTGLALADNGSVITIGGKDVCQVWFKTGTSRAWTLPAVSSIDVAVVGGGGGGGGAASVTGGGGGGGGAVVVKSSLTVTPGGAATISVGGGGTAGAATGTNGGGGGTTTVVLGSTTITAVGGGGGVANNGSGGASASQVGSGSVSTRTGGTGLGSNIGGGGGAGAGMNGFNAITSGTTAVDRKRLDFGALAATGMGAEGLTVNTTLFKTFSTSLYTSKKDIILGGGGDAGSGGYPPRIGYGQREMVIVDGALPGLHYYDFNPGGSSLVWGAAGGGGVQREMQFADTSGKFGGVNGLGGGGAGGSRDGTSPAGVGGPGGAGGVIVRFIMPDLPGKPTITTSTPTGTGSVGKVNIAVTNGTGTLPTEYVVQYRLNGTTAWTTLTPNPTTSPVTVSGLAAGVYNFQVASRNAVGTSANSSIVNGTALAVTRPAAPTTLAGNAKVTASVVLSTTGAIPTSYVIQAYQNGTAVAGKTCTVTPPATSCQVTGLTNGTAYTFTTTAYNGTDASLESLQSVATTPYTVPGAPTSLTATPLDSAMDVAFTAPASNGAAAITNYEYSLDGGLTWKALSPTDATSPVRLSGLVNGQSYSVKLRAVNAAGVGPASTDASGTPKAAGPPDAPTGLVATAKSSSAQIAFTAGANNGSAITNYKYELDGSDTWASLSPADATSPVTIPGLSNGTRYSIKLLAVNALGDGVASVSVTVTPMPLPPSAPTALAATPGNGQADISFNSPASDGGGSITNYQFSLDRGVTWTALSPDDWSSPVTIPNLVNGTPYTVALRAVNLTGPGPASSTVSVTPAGPPDAPVNLVAAANNESAQIAFTPGASNGSTIMNYEYQLGSGAWTALSPSDVTSPVTISGLTNSTAYTVTLRAVNAVGNSSPSASVSVTPMPLPPSAPAITTAGRGDGQATITFTAPASNGGGTITDYEYSTDGGVTWTSRGSTASPFTVTGLANGTQYSFTLRARNVSGPGPSSSPATVTPAGLPGAPVWVTSMPLDGAVSLTFTPGSANGSAITNYEYSIGGGPWTALSPADTASPVTIPGLTNGTGYNIGLRAINSVGPSQDWNGTKVVQVPCGTPTKPTVLVATPGTSQATINFTNANANGTPILNYQYSLDNGLSWIAFSPAVAGTPVTVPGLDQAIAYNIKLRAVNAAGNGIASDAVSVTIANLLTDRVPAAPTGLGATPSDRAASIAFTAPPTGSNVPVGGVATPVISNYEFSIDDGATWTALNSPQASSPVSLSGLDNGQLYSVRLRAVNSAGPGAVSAPVSFTPAVVPAAPTSLAATANSGSAQIDFAAGYNGGSAITNYKYQVGSGAWTSLGSTSSPVTIPGLTNGTPYTIQLRAVNAIGDGAISASVSVTPKALPPSAPTSLVATPPGNRQAVVSFTPPASDGGGAITNYEFSLDGGLTWTAFSSPSYTGSPVTIPNLVNGTPYTVALRAVNATGAGAASSAVTVTPVGPPDAPVELVATANSGWAQVAFTPGADNGAPITDYKYSLDNGGSWIALGSTTSPVTILGLSNGTAYSVKLRAVNAQGDGAASVSVSVTPKALPPSAPTPLSATPGDRQAVVSFSPPASDGGGAITNYQYSLDGGVTWAALSPASASSPVTILNLVNGTPYDITLRAVNSAGPGAASTPSPSVTPAGLPGTPTNLFAAPKDASAEVAFTAGTDNGSPITNYQYSLDGGVTWATLSPIDDASPVTVPGLTNGTPYSITLRAVNTAGVSAPSATAVSVTPAAPASKPTNLASIPLDDAGEISFTPPASDGGAAITNYQYSLNSGATWNSLSPVDAASPVFIPGLQNGVLATIVLRAVNAGGAGAASDPVTVIPAAAPAAPTALIAWPQSGQATITFTPGPDNGSAITEYLYSLNGGAAWTAVSSTESPVTVSGLTNGTEYTVKLRSKNGVGVGTISRPVSVTPAPPAPAPDSGPGPGPSDPTNPAGPGPKPLVSTPEGPDLSARVPGNNPNVPASGLAIGGSLLLVDEQPETVSVIGVPDRKPTALWMTGGGITMRLSASTIAGAPLPLAAGDALVLERDGLAHTEGTGFRPNSEVRVYLLSTPRLLGTLITDGNGAFKGSLPIPSDLALGRHTLQSNGVGFDGQVRSLSLGVKVQKNSQPSRTVRATSTVYFGAGSAVLTKDAKSELKKLAQRTRATARQVVAIGYVQESGNTANDRSLSKARADVVAKYLRAQGVKGAYAVYGKGVGGSNPQARTVVVTVAYVK